MGRMCKKQRPAANGYACFEFAPCTKLYFACPNKPRTHATWHVFAKVKWSSRVCCRSAPAAEFPAGKAAKAAATAGLAERRSVLIMGLCHFERLAQTLAWKICEGMLQ